jgi:HK97 family phage major capsid protein
MQRTPQTRSAPLETKQTGEHSIADVAAATANLAKAFEEFTTSNDARLKEVEKKGSADVLSEEKVNRINTDLTKLQDAVTSLGKKSEKLETIAMRPPLAGGTDGSKSQLTEAEQKYNSAYVHWARTGEGSKSELMELEKKAMESKATPMTVVSDPAGGYLVTPEMSDRIVARQFETSPFRQYATVQTISSDALELLRETGDFGAEFVGEEETRSDTDNGTFGHIRIEAKELHAQPKVSQKLLDDASINVEQYLSTKIAERFSRKENDSFANGSGVKTPRGFCTYPTAATADANRADLTFEHILSGASGAFTATTPGDKIISLIYAMKAVYLPQAAWFARRAVYEAVRKFKESTTNAYIWQPGLQAGQPALLGGYPVVHAEDMPALAADSLSMAFANLKESYTIVDRIGIRTLRDPFTAAPYVKFRTTKRVGGEVTNFEAIKFIKFNS